MIRLIVLYFYFLIYRAKYFGKIKFNGFTIIFTFKNSKISIGKRTIVNSRPTSNLLGLFQRTIIVARFGGEISIGENAGISGSTIYSMDKIRIGDNCLIGANCKIIDSDFHPLDPVKRKTNNPADIRKKAILIGHNCFIGMNSIILKGTTIGDNCIIGAGSVVQGKFESNTIIAGNPAKIIKYLE